MTQLTLEDALEDHNDTVNIGGPTRSTTPTQLTLEDALEDHNDTVNIGARTGRPQ